MCFVVLTVFFSQYLLEGAQHKTIKNKTHKNGVLVLVWSGDKSSTLDEYKSAYGQCLNKMVETEEVFRG
jgi:hypothetical protein